MPRRTKGAHLWLRPERRDKLERTIARAIWVILDGGRQFATRCAAGETERAEEQLAAYIAAKYRPTRREKDIEEIDIADVLSIYDDDHGPQVADRNSLDRRLERLNDFWGGRTLSEINGASCREYVEARASRAAARRDLEDLRAAVNHHAKEGFHRGVVVVSLPPRGQPRDRWLTRDEAARLLWTCWRTREVQTVHKGSRKGTQIETDKRPLRHLARFILIGLYTGTRASAIATASPTRAPGRSFVDLESGIFYRLAEGQAATNKRQPPVPIPPRLLAHLRRWSERGIAGVQFVEWNRQPVRSVKTAFASGVRQAGLSGKVTPHTLRHTAATWLMQSGVDVWEAAGFLGMSVQILERVYGHHHPAHLRSAALAIGYRARRVETLVESLVERPVEPTPIPEAVEIIGGPGRTRTCNQIVMSDRL
jgi:integrase